MTIPKTMSGVLLEGHGDLDQLRYRDDLAVPTPAEGEVLVRVGACAINNTDINTRTGWYGDDGGDVEHTGETWAGQAMAFPRIQGADVCGEIVAVGSSIDAERIGERILVEPCMPKPGVTDRFDVHYFGSELDGGFAQFVCVPEIYAHKIDSPLNDAELASFPCSYSTAENMLTRAGVKAGEKVLVTGASGGVGSAAVQLARRRGARVTAVAGASKSHAVFNLGADSVIPRGSQLAEALGLQSIDVVIDLVVGTDWPDLIDVLKRGGRYATAGAIAGPLVVLDVRKLYLKDLSFYGGTVLDPGVFANLVTYIEAGEIKPLVAKTFPLAEIADAQDLFLEKKHTGKIVLIPPS
ncbi:MAG: zinc-binding dehydrogenase [Rhodospirillaceae bacterium]|nr:zinc-binding dehydrogenase [Rhodospirillaceae bacterium]MBT5516081.1 zinc-binding dehydrogenase [Rhodospirillaceae bacterium]MBT6084691.1 zinc-binding dehydrogenase [Rhodospirillaceae bacterium]MBT7250424.1 zinc-binding dehydrogenase [Rhodospirillaceae bacterium]